MADLIDRQPDVPETNVGDMISRQAVLNLLVRCAVPENECGLLYLSIKNMPSAQPEPLTDTEQRIFLAAMGREEKVCKKVDDEYKDLGESCDVSLVRVCREIERKVKKALWTN